MPEMTEEQKEGIRQMISRLKQDNEDLKGAIARNETEITKLEGLVE
jgi:hypothetical protein